MATYNAHGGGPAGPPARHAGWLRGAWLRMRRLLSFGTLILGALVLPGLAIGLPAHASRLSPLQSLQSTAQPPAPEDQAQLQARLTEAVAAHTDVLAFTIFEWRVDEVLYSQDGTWALVTIAMADPATGDVIPAEPAVALARKSLGEWVVTLQADSDWSVQLAAVPVDLLPNEAKKQLAPPDPKSAEGSGPQAAAPYGGYRLPWPAGQGKYLSQSISHQCCNMEYAFDFYDGTMFQLVAARAGYVKWFQWSYPNGYYDGVANHANYLVLEDRTTSPYTYSLYLHLAYESIPLDLRTVGKYVARGQFIGLVDDTGYSSGHHLHFQVHTYPYSYWGSSVDMTFDDVAINGGRPRTTWEAASYGGQGQDYYVSGNSTGTDITPPSAGLSAPADRTVVTTSTVNMQGWATDGESGLSQAHFLVNYDSTWEQIGPFFTTSPFTYSWNLCSTGIASGPVSVAVKAYDRNGNPTVGYPGLRHFVNNAACAPPPPACTPTADQVALFALEDFGGTCVTKGIGRYATSSMFSPLDGNEARSIKVGANVYAIAFSEEDFFGRSETFGADDPNLGDNRINVYSISSLGVQRKSDIPSAPEPSWPPAAQTITQGDTVTLGWQHNGSYAIDQYKGGPYKYQAEGPAGYRTSWIHDQFARLSGSLFSLGTNYWWIRSRSCETDSSACWSPWFRQSTVNVIAAGGLPPAMSAPWNDTLESSTTNWRISGLWRLDGTPAHSGLHSFVYNSGGSYANGGAASEGNLTSPPITIPSSGYWMRFWYRYQTENNTRFWDQRWVQVSIDGGPFSDLYQLTDDPANTWLQSPPLNLASYAGHTVRFRFNFVTLDASDNNLAGWFIDDLEVNTVVPPACGDTHEVNAQPAQATPISGYGQVYSGDICPNGDVDFYSFSGHAGERVAAMLENLTALSPHIALLTDAGTSLLVENTGASVAYELPRDGTYYVLVRAADHPSFGGSNYGYSLRLVADNDVPQISLSAPLSDGYINTSMPGVAAQVSDAGGIRYVEFYRHTNDWSTDWVKLGEDWTGGDGWTMPVDPTGLPASGLAFFARAFDWGGHSSSAAVWNVALDRVLPVSSMVSLPATQPSTGFLVYWRGSDTPSGIDRFDLQVQRDGGPWADWLTGVNGLTTQALYIGEVGSTYGFRVRARDVAGNLEPYPSAAETATTILPCTGDAWEDDDSSAQAVAVAAGAASGPHNFCGAGDLDWYSFQAEAGQWYGLATSALGPTTDTVMRLFDQAGTHLATGDDRAPGTNLASYILWRAPTSGTYFAEVLSKDSRLSGDAQTYTFAVFESHPVFLPLITRSASP